MFWWTAQLILLGASFTLFIYTSATVFFPKQKRDAVADASGDSLWPVWQSEMENPYSILNSRPACMVLSPICFVLLCVEVWMFF